MSVPPSSSAPTFSFKHLFRSMQPTLERLLASLDARFSAFIQPRRLKGNIIVTPYVGWGTPQCVELSGRVLLPRTLPPPNVGDARWRNFLAVLRRLSSREVSGVKVRATLNGQVSYAMSDSDGFFSLQWKQTACRDGWHEAQLTIEGRSAVTTAQVRVVEEANYGVISDLDDTVLQSDVTSLPQMLGTVLTGNARTRLPFPGVSAMYRALTGAGGSKNPIFYVSSSPWNFFDLLWSFLQYRRIPLGPLFLRNWGAELLNGHGNHKHTIIERLMERFPALPFVLIGDSGEQDPEIYTEVVRRHPGRVLAVYIRDVTGGKRDEGVRQLAEEVARSGVPLILARDSLAAAAHAFALGLISPTDLKHVTASIEKSLGSHLLPTTH